MYFLLDVYCKYLYACACMPWFLSVARRSKELAGPKVGYKYIPLCSLVYSFCHVPHPSDEYKEFHIGGLKMLWGRGGRSTAASSMSSESVELNGSWNIITD